MEYLYKVGMDSYPLFYGKDDKAIDSDFVEYLFDLAKFGFNIRDYNIMLFLAQNIRDSAPQKAAIFADEMLNNISGPEEYAEILSSATPYPKYTSEDIPEEDEKILNNDIDYDEVMRYTDEAAIEYDIAHSTISDKEYLDSIKDPAILRDIYMWRHSGLSDNEIRRRVELLLSGNYSEAYAPPDGQDGQRRFDDAIHNTVLRSMGYDPETFGKPKTRSVQQQSVPSHENKKRNDGGGTGMKLGFNRRAIEDDDDLEGQIGSIIDMMRMSGFSEDEIKAQVELIRSQYANASAENQASDEEVLDDSDVVDADGAQTDVSYDQQQISIEQPRIDVGHSQQHGQTSVESTTNVGSDVENQLRSMGYSDEDVAGTLAAFNDVDSTLQSVVDNTSQSSAAEGQPVQPASSDFAVASEILEKVDNLFKALGDFGFAVFNKEQAISILSKITGNNSDIAQFAAYAINQMDDKQFKEFVRKNIDPESVRFEEFVNQWSEAREKFRNEEEKRQRELLKSIELGERAKAKQNDDNNSAAGSVPGQQGSVQQNVGVEGTKVVDVSVYGTGAVGTKNKFQDLVNKYHMFVPEVPGVKPEFPNAAGLGRYMPSERDRQIGMYEPIPVVPLRYEEPGPYMVRIGRVEKDSVKIRGGMLVKNFSGDKNKGQIGMITGYVAQNKLPRTLKLNNKPEYIVVIRDDGKEVLWDLANQDIVVNASQYKRNI
jgi:hypothetical protein